MPSLAFTPWRLHVGEVLLLSAQILAALCSPASSDALGQVTGAAGSRNAGRHLLRAHVRVLHVQHPRWSSPEQLLRGFH